VTYRNLETKTDNVTSYRSKCFTVIDTFAGSDIQTGDFAPLRINKWRFLVTKE
jgi:hypothetical protein